MKEEDRGYLLNEIGARKIAANVLRDFQKVMPGLDVDPIRSTHVPSRASHVHVDARTLRAGATIGPAADESVFFANTDSEGPESTTNEAILAAQRGGEASRGASGGQACAQGNGCGRLSQAFSRFLLSASKPCGAIRELLLEPSTHSKVVTEALRR